MRHPTLRRATYVGRGSSLVALGDLVLDVVARADRAVVEGSDTPGTVNLRVGGSAANAARAFVRAGGKASFIGAVGRDPWAGPLVAALRREGVVVHAVRKVGLTARIVVLLDRHGERSFITHRGVADELAPEDLRDAWWRGAGALHLPAYSLLASPLAEAALRAVVGVRAAGGAISVDLASRGPLLEHGLGVAWERIGVARPDILFANRDEAAALVGTRGLRALLQLAHVVVVKEGVDGCQVLYGVSPGRPQGDRLAVATRPLEVADSTGAGDAFDAGFLAAWLSERDGARASPGRQAQVLRRAAVAGHRAATRLLSRPRPELGR